MQSSECCHEKDDSTLIIQSGTLETDISPSPSASSTAEITPEQMSTEIALPDTTSFDDTSPIINQDFTS